MILQQQINAEQMSKLLEDKKTDLLNGFISARTKRKFSSYLVIKEGKVGFEFLNKSKSKN